MSKLRCALAYVAHLRGELPDTAKPVRSTHSTVAKWIETRTAERCTRGQVNGMIDRWPLPKLTAMDLSARAAGLAGLHRLGDVLGLPPDAFVVVSVKCDGAAPLSTDVERARAMTVMRQFAQGPDFAEIVQADGEVRRESVGGREGRPQRLLRLRAGQSIYVDAYGGVLEACRYTNVLASHAGLADDPNPYRLDLAQEFRDLHEAAQLSGVGSPAMERASAGYRSGGITDRALNASRELAHWRAALEAHEVGVLWRYLEAAFVNEAPGCLTGAAVEKICCALDAVWSSRMTGGEAGWRAAWGARRFTLARPLGDSAPAVPA